MGFEQIAEEILVAAASAAAPKLATLLAKLLTKQPITKDEALQSLGGAAADLGLEGGDMARSVTEAGARRTEEAVALAGAALYPPGETP